MVMCGRDYRLTSPINHPTHRGKHMRQLLVSYTLRSGFQSVRTFRYASEVSGFVAKHDNVIESYTVTEFNTVTGEETVISGGGR
jgi:hypothetical protein